MKYYNVELNLKDAEQLQSLLYDLNVKHEISAAWNLYHFEILLEQNSREYNRINRFLNSL